MSLVVRLAAPDEEWQPLGSTTLTAMRSQGPSETLLAVENEHIAAHASVWWRGTARLDGAPTGVVGHYEAANAEAGVAVLRAAVRLLNDQGCQQVVGPMDGTTWRRYRLVTSQGGEPPFFMEPMNPAEYVGHFEAARFGVLAQYYSSLDSTLQGDDARVDEVFPRLTDRGVVIRDIDLGRFEEELARVHELSLQAFASNFMYSPIDRQEFVDSYRMAKQLVRPGMVLMAEAGEELLGFMFAIPDIKQREPDTAIAKTVAVRPGRRGAGLGSVLIELSRRAARRLGYRRFIYALMHESNKSTRIAGRFAVPFREYALFVHRGPA